MTLKAGEVYLGDNVCASTEGAMIRLRVESLKEQVLFLERETFCELLRYAWFAWPGLLDEWIEAMHEMDDEARNARESHR